MIVTAHVDKVNPKLTSNPWKRQPSPSATGASNAFEIMHEVFDFLLDINPSALDVPEDFGQFLSDLEYISNHEMNEEKHFAKKSDAISRIRARKFYKAKKAKILAMQKKLKDNKSKQKKKQIMKKSGRTLTGKTKKKYPGTKKHVSDARLKKGARLIVEKWFSPHSYRVIKSFTLNEKVTARLNEEILHWGNDTFEIIKRDGRHIKFEVPPGKIIPFLKMGALCTEDII
jgi:hypothetical protein